MILVITIPRFAEARATEIVEKGGSLLIFPEGEYRIGIDIPAGEYKITNDDSRYHAYYYIFTDLSKSEIVQSDSTKNSMFCVVSNGQLLKVEGGTLEYLGRSDGLSNPSGEDNSPSGNVSASKGYGAVSGLITWQYNDFIGTRGDNGAKVMLIPDNDNVKNYDNYSACLFISGRYESGVLVSICDGYGNFNFGNEVPAGNYKVLVVSNNARGSGRFTDEQMKEYFGKYFSDKDLDMLKLAISSYKVVYDTLEVKSNYEHTLSHDFGNTYF